MSFNALPIEIKTLVVQAINSNGDISRVRLVSPQLNFIADSQHEVLKKDTCVQHDVPKRLLKIYECAYEKQYSEGSGTYALLQLIHLQHEIAMINTITAKVECLPRVPIFSPMPPALRQTEQFLLLSAFSRMLRSTSTPNAGQCPDVLAPSQTANNIIPVQLTTTFQEFLHEHLCLDELESIISAINICASKLWSNIFLFRPLESAVRTFPSLSGYTFNKDQAILTEHVIWRGPTWVARLLKGHDNLPEATKQDDHYFLEHGAWTGSQEDGARLAANGLARYIWLERQRKVEIEAKQNTQTQKPNDFPGFTDTKVDDDSGV